MNTKTRLREKQENTRRGATTIQEWRDLCKKALKAAEAIKDRRVQGLQSALENGREQQALRSMGIICEADLAREFSKTKI